MYIKVYIYCLLSIYSCVVPGFRASCFSLSSKQGGNFILLKRRLQVEFMMLPFFGQKKCSGERSIGREIVYAANYVFSTLFIMQEVIREIVLKFSSSI